MTAAVVTTQHVTVSIVEAGKLLGIGRDKTYDLVRMGQFPIAVFDIYGKKRVRLSDVETYLDGLADCQRAN